jgi:hypothetical protein
MTTAPYHVEKIEMISCERAHGIPLQSTYTTEKLADISILCHDKQSDINSAQHQFSLLSKQLRSIKNKVRFIPIHEHHFNLISCDMDGTRVRDILGNGAWTSVLVNVEYTEPNKIYYFEIEVQALSPSGKFIMVGLINKNAYPPLSCISDLVSSQIVLN